MVRAVIIEEVSWSTDWCSRGFFVDKTGQEGKLRMVTDFHVLNTHLKRTVWPFPSAENIRRSLNCEDRVFAKVDLCSGNHKIPIQESDRDLTCFLLPWGKYKYCVFPMAFSPSRNVFCHRTDQAVRDLEGMMKFVDNCLAGGRGVDQLGVRLRELLSRLLQSFLIPSYLIQSHLFLSELICLI